MDSDSDDEAVSTQAKAAASRMDVIDLMDSPQDRNGNGKENINTQQVTGKPKKIAKPILDIDD
jgi:hypothetical protein